MDYYIKYQYYISKIQELGQQFDNFNLDNYS